MFFHIMFVYPIRLQSEFRFLAHPHVKVSEK